MDTTLKKTNPAIKIIKKILLGLLFLFTTILLAVIIYVIAITAMYYRIGDEELTPSYNKDSLSESSLEKMSADTVYSILTYNIGFGAYSPDFDFFADGGSGSIAKDTDTVLFNTDGVSKVINSTGADIVLMQEIDKDATRSWYQNQVDIINGGVTGNFEVSYSSYFHVPYLMYPPFNPIGRAEAGIVTMSKFASSSVNRYELPVDDSWPSKLFDLDRCYTVSRIPVSNKELVIVNIHLTAFEEKGIRAKQMDALKTLLTDENDLGNYLIIGGDFNHDLYETTFKTTPSWMPSGVKDNELWISYLSEDFLSFLSSQGYSVSIPLNEPTCRSSKYPYEASTSRAWTIDGFIVSSNIETIKTTVPTEVSGYTNFLYSDHNPVYMEFKLDNIS